MVTPYVRDRLNREWKWGYSTALARKTGFSSQHISKIRGTNANVGADFAEALAHAWEFKNLDALIAEAKRYNENLAAETIPVDKITAIRVLATESGIPADRVERHLAEAALKGRAEWTVMQHLEELRREELGTAAATTGREKDRRRAAKSELDEASARPPIRRRKDH